MQSNEVEDTNTEILENSDIKNEVPDQNDVVLLDTESNLTDSSLLTDFYSNPQDKSETKDDIDFDAPKTSDSNSDSLLNGITGDDTESQEAKPKSDVEPKSEDNIDNKAHLSSAQNENNQYNENHRPNHDLQIEDVTELRTPSNDDPIIEDISDDFHGGIHETDETLEEDDDDLEESIFERIYGLTEMFPESFRNGVCTLSSKSLELIKNSYSVSRAVSWIFFSSTSLMLVPLFLETERLNMKRALDKQMLMGSGPQSPGGLMGMPPPPAITK